MGSFICPIYFVLLLLPLALSEHTGFLVSQLATHLIGPPFFKNITNDGKIAYYKILNNKTLTRGQQSEQLIKWGTDNKVEVPVRSYIEKQARDLQEFRGNITNFLSQLLEYEKDIDSIYFDNNLTVEQREHLLFTLECPAPMKKILSYAATMVKRYGLPRAKTTTRAPITTRSTATSSTVTPTTAGNNSAIVAASNVTTTTAGGNVTYPTTAAQQGNSTSAPTTVRVIVVNVAPGNVTTTASTSLPVTTTARNATNATPIPVTNLPISTTRNSTVLTAVNTAPISTIRNSTVLTAVNTAPHHKK